MSPCLYFRGDSQWFWAIQKVWAQSLTHPPTPSSSNNYNTLRNKVKERKRIGLMVSLNFHVKVKRSGKVIICSRARTWEHILRPFKLIAAIYQSLVWYTILQFLFCLRDRNIFTKVFYSSWINTRKRHRKRSYIFQRLNWLVCEKLID